MAVTFSLIDIIDYNGKIYIFGSSITNNYDVLNDMLILDTINLNWEKGSSVNAPTPRIGYDATLLLSQHIIYLDK